MLDLNRLVHGTDKQCVQCGQYGHDTGDTKCPILQAQRNQFRLTLKSGTHISYDKRGQEISIDFPEDGVDSFAVSYGRKKTIAELERVVKFLKDIPRLDAKKKAELKAHVAKAKKVKRG